MWELFTFFLFLFSLDGLKATVINVDSAGRFKVHVLSRTCALHLTPTSCVLMRVTERFPVTLSGHFAAVSLSKTPDPYQSGGCAAWM